MKLISLNDALALLGKASTVLVDDEPVTLEFNLHPEHCMFLCLFTTGNDEDDPVYHYHFLKEDNDEVELNGEIMTLFGYTVNEVNGRQVVDLEDGLTLELKLLIPMVMEQAEPEYRVELMDDKDLPCREGEFFFTFTVESQVHVAARDKTQARRELGSIRTPFGVRVGDGVVYFSAAEVSTAKHVGTYDPNNDKIIE